MYHRDYLHSKPSNCLVFEKKESDSLRINYCFVSFPTCAFKQENGNLAISNLFHVTVHAVEQSVCIKVKCQLKEKM